MDRVWVDAIGYIGGGLLAGCFLPQIVRVIATRSVQDISILWSILYTSGLALTTVYLIFKNAPAAWIPSLFEFVGGLLVLALKLFFDNTKMGQRMCAARLAELQAAMQQLEKQQDLEQQQQQQLEAEQTGAKKEQPSLAKSLTIKQQKSLRLTLPHSPSWKLPVGVSTPGASGSYCGSPLAAYSSSGFSSMFGSSLADSSGGSGALPATPRGGAVPATPRGDAAAASAMISLEGGISSAHQQQQQQQHVCRRAGSALAVSTRELPVDLSVVDPAGVVLTESPGRRGFTLSAPGSFHRAAAAALSHTPGGTTRAPTKLQWSASVSRSESGSERSS